MSVFRGSSGKKNTPPGNFFRLKNLEILPAKKYLPFSNKRIPPLSASHFPFLGWGGVVFSNIRRRKRKGGVFDGRSVATKFAPEKWPKANRKVYRLPVPAFFKGKFC